MTDNESGMSAQGLKGAENMARMLHILSTAGAGGHIADTARRDPKVTNSQIFEYQKKQGRDVTPTEEQAEEYAKQFIARYTAQLKKVGLLDKMGTPATVEKMASQGIVAGLRDLLRRWSKDVASMIKRGVDNEGAALKAVSEKYAQQRERKYHTNKSAVYIASMQLINAVTKGKIKINYDGKKLASFFKK